MSKNSVRTLLVVAAVMIVTALLYFGYIVTPLGGTPSSALPTGASPDFAPTPESFVGGFHNPYLSYRPGYRLIYEQVSDGDKDEEAEITIIEMTGATKVITGVTTSVIRDRVFVGGKLTEETSEFVAEDRDGTLWLFGEAASEYKDGAIVSTHDSWVAGEKGARPGVLMPGKPKVGDRYYSVRVPDMKEDRQEVVGIEMSVAVGSVAYDRCVKIHTESSLDPSLDEFKYYCPEVGAAVLIEEGGGDDEIRLVKVESGT